MYLYNLTLKPSSASISSVLGYFDKKQYLVTATGSGIDLFTADEEKVENVNTQYSFGIIQSLAKIRPLGFDKDLLVITSDSGNLTICELHGNRFVPLVQEPHSKNGLRSLTPGEYLNIDPQNRAIMISATERNKLVYRVHIEDGKINLGTPLESFNKLFTLSTCALDTGFENPTFAAIEIELSKVVLNYYELDQGLNHIIKRSESIPQSANLLIPYDGLLVCCEGFVLHNGKELKLLDQKSIITNYIIHKIKKTFLVLLQDHLGRLYKFEPDNILYFGTIPTSSNMSIFKNGLLYVDAVNTNKLAYQIVGLETSDKIEELDNLELVQTIETLDPILDFQVKDSKLIALTADHLKSLVHAIPTSTIVESPLPIDPIKIFTTKLSQESINDDYLVLSSTSSTMILSIGEEVAEVTDSNFSTDPTIGVQQVGRSSVVQIYAYGIKHIDSKKKVTDWYPPAGINIICTSTNNKQLVVALSNNEIVYFEVDTDDQLIEYQDRLEVSTNITAIALSEKFAVVGCADQSIQVISLQKHNCLDILSLQMLSSNSSSLLFFDQEVHIGMENGLYVRTSIDVKGKLSNTRIKYLGPKAVTLTKIDATIMAISSKPWIGFKKSNTFQIAPLHNVTIQGGASFYSEDIGGEGVVGFNGNELVIFTIDELINDFIVESTPVEAHKLLIAGDTYTVGSQLIKNLSDQASSAIEDRVLSVCKLDDKIVIGTSKFIYTFKDLNLLHKTEVDKPARAMIEFHGKLLVGMDNLLRIYELGKKQLLKKSSTVLHQINKVVKLTYQGKNRVVVGDSQHSTIFCKFQDNAFVAIADDTMNRQITALETLDYDTVVGGDKFGNIFINRIPKDNEYFVEDSFLNGSSARVKTLGQFFLNDIPMSFNKSTMVVGGDEVIIYSALQGTIGVLAPVNETDYKFFNNLQLELKETKLLDRDLVKFRSYYNHTHNIIDGDLIETFFHTDVSTRIKIAKKLNRSTKDIENKINDIRDKSAF